MRKILLIVAPQTTGLQYHRQLAPHNHLLNKYEGFEVNQAVIQPDGFGELTDEKLKEYHAVSFLRNISLQGRTKEYIKRCQDLGLKVFFDIDDYWRLPKSHAMYAAYKEHDISFQVEEALEGADLVITTTPFMRSLIKGFNENVVVIPNSIDTEQPQFQPRKIENARVRFGWIGGVYHYEDLLSIKHNFKLLDIDKTIRDKWQVCCGGYTAGQSEYGKIEQIMTNDFRMVQFDNDYSEYLYKGIRTMEHVSFDKPYRRLWGRDAYSYGELYNDIDVALIPLVDRRFNNMKSQLKIIEAGFMKKAIIVSEVMPYVLDCTIDNSILIKDNHTGWYVAMKKLINNQELIKEYSERLYESVQQFNMNKVNDLRAEVYNYYLS